MRLEVETGLTIIIFPKPPEMPEEFRTEAFGHVRLFPGKCVFLGKVYCQAGW